MITFLIIVGILIVAWRLIIAFGGKSKQAAHHDVSNLSATSDLDSVSTVIIAGEVVQPADSSSVEHHVHKHHLSPEPSGHHDHVDPGHSSHNSHHDSSGSSGFDLGGGHHGGGHH